MMNKLRVHCCSGTRARSGLARGFSHDGLAYVIGSKYTLAGADVFLVGLMKAFVWSWLACLGVRAYPLAYISALARLDGPRLDITPRGLG
jgi:hypothetical protein